MRIIITVNYVFAVLTACNFVLTVVVIVALMMFTDTFGLGSQESNVVFGGVFRGVMLIIASLLGHGLLVVLLMASAESIRIGIDIQQNTQEVAFNSKMSRQGW